MSVGTIHKVGSFVRTKHMRVRGDAISARWNLHAGSIAEIEAIRFTPSLQYVVRVPWSPVELWIVDPWMIAATAPHEPSWAYLEGLTGWRRPERSRPLLSRIYDAFLFALIRVTP